MGDTYPFKLEFGQTAAPDSLFDSLLRAFCGTPGRSVAQTGWIAEYVWHALTRPDASWQGRSISS